MSENGADRKLELYPFIVVSKCPKIFIMTILNFSFVSQDLFRLFQLLAACTEGFDQAHYLQQPNSLIIIK